LHGRVLLSASWAIPQASALGNRPPQARQKDPATVSPLLGRLAFDPYFPKTKPEKPVYAAAALTSPNADSKLGVDQPL
jgi:hypothetical protein